MIGHNQLSTIERFPEYGPNRNLKGVSFGCPELDLMGYVSLSELLSDIYNVLKNRMKIKK
jgi:hypothetical protein